MKNRIVSVLLSASLLLSPIVLTSCGERTVYGQIINELSDDVPDWTCSDCLNIHYGKVGEEYVVGVKTKYHTRFANYYDVLYYIVSEEDYNTFTENLPKDFTHASDLNEENAQKFLDLITKYYPANVEEVGANDKVDINNYKVSENQK